MMNDRVSKMWNMLMSSMMSKSANILMRNPTKRTAPTALKRGAGRLSGKMRALNISPIRKAMVISTRSQTWLFRNSMTW